MDRARIPGRTALGVPHLSGHARQLDRSAEDPDDECAAETSNACGRDGECTGGGSCRVRAIGTACGTAACSGDTLTPQGSCNGASTCNAATAAACPDNLTCASASACRTSCSSDSHCRSGYYCAGNSCAQKKSKGAGCGAANECTSGFCKDQFCCDGACSLSCQGCSLAGSSAWIHRLLP